MMIATGNSTASTAATTHTTTATSFTSTCPAECSRHEYSTAAAATTDAGSSSSSGTCCSSSSSSSGASPSTSPNSSSCVCFLRNCLIWDCTDYKSRKIGGAVLKLLQFCEHLSSSEGNKKDI